jgi:hypothetical protein
MSLVVWDEKVGIKISVELPQIFLEKIGKSLGSPHPVVVVVLRFLSHQKLGPNVWVNQKIGQEKTGWVPVLCELEEERLVPPLVEGADGRVLRMMAETVILSVRKMQLERDVTLVNVKGV